MVINTKKKGCFSDLELRNVFFPFKILKIARTDVQRFCLLGETTELVSQCHIIKKMGKRVSGKKSLKINYSCAFFRWGYGVFERIVLLVLKRRKTTLGQEEMIRCLPEKFWTLIFPRRSSHLADSETLNLIVSSFLYSELNWCFNVFIW